MQRSKGNRRSCPNLNVILRASTSNQTGASNCNLTKQLESLKISESKSSIKTEKKEEAMQICKHGSIAKEDAFDIKQNPNAVLKSNPAERIDCLKISHASGIHRRASERRIARVAIRRRRSRPFLNTGKETRKLSKDDSEITKMKQERRGDNGSSKRFPSLN